MNSQIPKYHATLPQHQVQQVQAQGLGLQSHGQGHELGNRLQVQSLNNPQGQDRPQILQYDMINHFQQFGQTYPIYQTPLYKYPYQNNQQHHHQHQNQYQQQQSQRVQHQILQLPKLEPSPIIHQPSQLHHAQFHPQFYGMQQDVPISYSHYEHKSLNTKRHKKSKSFPDNKPLDHSSSSGNSKKSHYAEAPSSKDIKFPISQFSSNKFTPLTGLMLNNLYTKIEVKKYSTSAIDPLRNYLTVYEYPVNKHWVIWDYETGFVHLTGIWKASLNEQAEDNQQQLQPQQYVPKSHSKADIVKLLETTPKQYQQHIKRIRGGFLKIQGTWLPYYLCKIVARKFCYYIRYELVPIFGEDFLILA